MNYQKLYPQIICLTQLILLFGSCGSPLVPTPSTLPVAASVTPWPTFTPPPPALAPQPAVSEPTPTLPPSLPPPGRPTLFNVQAQQAGARVGISAQPATVMVGDLIALTGKPANLGLPQYTLYLEGKPAMVIRYDGAVMYQDFTGAKVELVSASAGQNEAIFNLRAAQPGLVTAMISVPGETRLDTGQGPTTGFAWRSVTSPGVTLNIGSPSQPQIDLGGAPIRAWAWSPDGRSLVFASNRDGNWNLYVISSGGGQPVRFTAAPGDERDPVWSPDGTTIAFVANAGGNFDVYALPLPNGLLAEVPPERWTQITATPTDERFPTWEQVR